MKSLKTGALSGCVVWIILIGMVSACILPIGIAAGSFTSSSDTAIRITGGILCPENTTPKSHSYATTTRDEYGSPRPATAYEMHCVDSTGAVVKKDLIAFAFLWIGFAAVIGLAASALISFIIAAPAGALIAKLLSRLKKTE